MQETKLPFKNDVTEKMPNFSCEQQDEASIKKSFIELSHKQYDKK